MLRVLWARRHAQTLRTARSVQPWRAASHSLSLALPRISSQDSIDHERAPRAPNYSTSIPAVADQTVALLKARRLEDAATVLNRFSKEEDNENFILAVVDRFLAADNRPLDSGTLFAWLGSLPDATTVSSTTFHQVLERLVANRGLDVALVKEFGLLCASKGYHDFVAVHVSPIIAERASAEEFANWEQQRSRAADEFNGLQTPGVVLEEHGQDYASLPPAIPSPPTILQQLEEALPALLSEPATDYDTLFEAHSVEYDQSPSPHTSLTGSLTMDVFEEFVKAGRINEAIPMARQLREMGVSFPVHIPLIAANMFLGWANNLDPHSPWRTTKRKLRGIQDGYLHWLRLIPAANAGTTEQDLQAVEDLLRNVLTLHHPSQYFITTTARLLAQKGYRVKSLERAVDILMRIPNSVPDFVSFVYTLEADLHAMGHKEVDQRLRNVAIHGLASVSRLDPAFRLLQDTLDLGRHYLDDATVQSLIRHVRAVGPEAVKNWEAQLLDLLPSDMHDVYGTPPTFPLTRVLETTFEQLIAAFESNRCPPDVRIMCDFMESCDSAGRRDLPTALLNKAMHVGYNHTSKFLEAEMLVYYKHRRYRALVETVEDHFYYGGGLPLAVVHRWKAPRTYTYITPGPTNGDILKPREHNQPTERLLDPELLRLCGERILPSSKHCNLFWEATFATTLDGQVREWLYKLLLDCYHDARRPAPTDITAPTEATQHVHSPDSFNMMRHLPSRDLFLAITGKMMKATGVDGAATIIRDMVRLGMRPSIEQMQTLLCEYARCNQSETAMALLTNMEAGFGKDRVPLEKRLRNTPKPLVPNVTLYLTLAQVFMDEGHYAAAREVVERMEKNVDLRAIKSPLREFIPVLFQRLDHHERQQVQPEENAVDIDGADGSEEGRANS